MECDSGERNFFHTQIPLAGRTSHSDICSPTPAVIFMKIFDRVSIYRSIRWENINNLSEFLISFWCMKARIWLSVDFSSSLSSAPNSFCDKLICSDPLFIEDSWGLIGWPRENFQAVTRLSVKPLDT